ncbi:MAG: hypothetical protein E7617_01975 [Ruminococcaceae bacterium]|nr:hypothetical protein [Oscillospiraceae bacterium]
MRLLLFILIASGLVAYFYLEVQDVRRRALEYEDVGRLISAIRRGIAGGRELCDLIGGAEVRSEGGKRLKKAIEKSRYENGWREGVSFCGIGLDEEDMRRLCVYFSDFGKGTDGAELRGAAELQEHFCKKEKQIAASAESTVRSGAVMLAAAVLGLLILIY